MFCRYARRAGGRPPPSAAEVAGQALLVELQAVVRRSRGHSGRQRVPGKGGSAILVCQLASGGIIAGGELGRFEDTRALRKVIESLEQRMTRKLTQIDERLARGPRAKSGQRSRPPPQSGEAAAAAALAGENSGGQSRRRRTPSRGALAAEVDDQMMTC